MEEGAPGLVLPSCSDLGYRVPAPWGVFHAVSSHMFLPSLDGPVWQGHATHQLQGCRDSSEETSCLPGRATSQGHGTARRCSTRVLSQRAGGLSLRAGVKGQESRAPFLGRQTLSKVLRGIPKGLAGSQELLAMWTQRLTGMSSLVPVATVCLRFFHSPLALADP